MTSKARHLAALAAEFARANDKMFWLRDQYIWWLFRRRLRQQQLINRAFDQRFGTETATEVNLEDAGVDPADVARGNAVYRPFWESEFRAVLESLPVKFAGFTFVDLGSGKGKLLMLASDYPFRHIAGVEYAPSLHAIAVANLERYRSPIQRCKSFEPILGDALKYQLHPGPVICLIFNAMNPATTAQVMNNLDHDAGGRQDPVFVIYANLRSVAEIAGGLPNTIFLKRMDASNKHVVFANAAGQREYAKTLR